MVWYNADNSLSFVLEKKTESIISGEDLLIVVTKEILFIIYYQRRNFVEG